MNQPAHLNPENWTVFDHRARLLLIVGALLSYAAFWWAAKLFHLPAYPSHGISLIQQPLVGLLVTLVVLLVCVLLGTLVAGSIRFDAGLFSAAAGLLALSIQGGSIRGLMLSAGSPALFMSLALEMLLLGAILLAGWQLQWLMHRNEWLKPDEIRDGVLDVPQPITQKLLALAVQVVVMALVMLLLAQSDRQAQVILAVGLAAFFGTLASYYVGPVQPSVWFWMGPIIVGTLGYLLTYASPAGWEIADPRGYFAPLARPLPLDYAGAGTIGALMGYWLSRRWQANAEAAVRERSASRPASAS